MNRLKKLCRDDAGFVVSAELVLIATILVVGMIVGLATIRDQVLQELADVADAASEVDQSFVFTGLIGHSVSTSGTIFNDTADDCEETAGSDQGTGPGGEPSCLDVNLDSLIFTGGEGIP